MNKERALDLIEDLIAEKMKVLRMELSCKEAGELLMYIKENLR